MDEPTYAKSVEYTLAKGRFAEMRRRLQYGRSARLCCSAACCRGRFSVFTHWLGESAWAMAAFLFAVGLALSLPGLPLDWYEQFRLEERFGFNTTTPEALVDWTGSKGCCWPSCWAIRCWCWC